MIFITGDIHGELEIDRLSEDSLAEAGIEPSEDDCLIILGDVGVVFETKPWELPDLAPSDQEVAFALLEQPWTVLFIDGNHDNTDTLYDADEEEWHGGIVHKIAPRLIHLMRGQTYEIEGLSFFVMGGAASIDRQLRTEGEDWWVSEIPTEDDFIVGRKNLQANDNTVDVVLTHTAPTSILEELVYGETYPDGLTDYLQWILNNVDFESWYFGHFHDDATCSESRLRCVYNDIIELDE